MVKPKRISEPKMITFYLEDSLLQRMNKLTAIIGIRFNELRRGFIRSELEKPSIKQITVMGTSRNLTCVQIENKFYYKIIERIKELDVSISRYIQQIITDKLEALKNV